MANRTRNIVLRVPVTAEERAMIERKMQQMGTGCFSVYARKMLIDGYVIRLDYSDVKAMTAELQKIGTNINQIAKRVNATGIVFRVTSSCNGYHSFRFFCRSQGGRTRQISHILIGFRQANRNSPGCQISACPNQGLPCRARQGRYSSCRWWTER